MACHISTKQCMRCSLDPIAPVHLRMRLLSFYCFTSRNAWGYWANFLEPFMSIIVHIFDRHQERPGPISCSFQMNSNFKPVNNPCFLTLRAGMPSLGERSEQLMTMWICRCLIFISHSVDRNVTYLREWRCLLRSTIVLGSSTQS